MGRAPPAGSAPGWWQRSSPSRSSAVSSGKPSLPGASPPRFCCHHRGFFLLFFNLAFIYFLEKTDILKITSVRFCKQLRGAASPCRIQAHHCCSSCAMTNPRWGDAGKGHDGLGPSPFWSISGKNDPVSDIVMSLLRGGQQPSRRTSKSTAGTHTTYHPTKKHNPDVKSHG